MTLHATVLCLYLAIQAGELLLTTINLKYLAAHCNKVPLGFESHVDLELLIRMRDYTLATGRLGIAASVMDVLATTVLLFGGLLNWYNNYIRSLGWPLIVSAVVFFMLLSIFGTLLHIPFDLYATFQIEKKYQFNKKTPRLWLADLVKTLLLSSVLYAILISVLFLLLHAMPNYWWLAGWSFLLVFSIFLIYLSPSVIEPLFNTFAPITDPELETRIKETLKKAGLSISRVFVMDASRRSTHSNAYFTGIGRVKRIVLFDTLIKNHTDDEIIAILAHEAGHWKKKHLLKMLILSQVILLIGFFFADYLLNTTIMTDIFLIDQPTPYATLFLITFVGTLVVFPLKPLSSLLSRRHELEADDFALQLTGDSKSMAEGLMRLGRDNLANLFPHPWYAAFYYSHPPLVERVARMKAKTP